MKWIRVNDDMPLNGKVGELSDGEFRALIALWTYCSRKGNDGVFTARELKHAIYTTAKGPRHVKESQLERFCELSLVVAAGDAYEVNDWRQFQPKDSTGAERQREWRKRRRA